MSAPSRSRTPKYDERAVASPEDVLENPGPALSIRAAPFVEMLTAAHRAPLRTRRL
jgi:hypothetical protein